jgi:hypothetical protein
MSHPQPDPLILYLRRSRVGSAVLRAIERNWRSGWTTTVGQQVSAWRGVYPESTISHAFTELHRLRAVVRLGGNPWVYRPRLKKDGDGFSLANPRSCELWTGMPLKQRRAV